MSSQTEELIRDNLPLVYAVAARSFPKLREDPDLIQCGRIGLWQAAGRWDGQRPFVPYACSSIRNAMCRWLRSLRRQGSSSSLPPDQLAETWDELLVDELGLRQRIASAWPRDSLEYHVLNCLADGVPKETLAARLGCSTWALTRLARRAWQRVPL